MKPGTAQERKLDVQVVRRTPSLVPATESVLPELGQGNPRPASDT